MREKHVRKNSLKQKILEHIYKNLKSYIIVVIVFIIGIVLGVFLVNNTNEGELTEIQEYITNFINSLKEDYHIDKIELLKKSIWDNFILIFIMWIIGSTVIGIPIIFAIVLYRSFCIGYTISAVIATIGTQSGTIFILSTIFLQNILFIPTIIAMTVSSINLYKSIMKDKRRENIKIEILRHTILSVMFFISLSVASLIEVYISTNLLMLAINFL